MSEASFPDLDELRRDPSIRAVEAVAASSRMGPLYLVGGYLRDLLLGSFDQAHHRRFDLDLVIWGDLERFGRGVATALQGHLIRLDPETVRAIVRFPLKDCGNDVSHRVMVQIDISRPKGETIDDDLVARDFTVNALAVRIDGPPGQQKAVVIDPAGGLNDLRGRRLRAPAPSAFDRDPLRLIRAVRLAAELDFTIEEATRRWIIERAPLLGTAAGERLRDELFRILVTVPAAPFVEQLDTLQLLRVLVPEAPALKSVPVSQPHRLPLWEHSLEALRSVELLLRDLGQLFPDDALWLRERLDREVEASVSGAAILKLVGFLHDIGKPQTRSVHPDGRVRFLGHEQAGLPILGRLCERLRLGRDASRLVMEIERHHLRPIHLGSLARVTARAQYRLFRELGDAAPAVLLHSWADLRATIGEEAEAFSRHQRFLREAFRFYGSEFAASQLSPVVRGDDLIEALGLVPGPFLGFIVDCLREAQATRCITSREEGLAYVRERLDTWRQSFEERPAPRQSPAKNH